jgi:hypothetical protein
MNDFGGQEPGSNKDISAFCVNQYAIDFPMFAKTDLKSNPSIATWARPRARRRNGTSTSIWSTAAAGRCRASERGRARGSEAVIPQSKRLLEDK